MKKERMAYEAPISDVLELRFGDNILVVASPTSNDNTEPITNGWDSDL